MPSNKEVCECGYNTAKWYAHLLRAYQMYPYDTSFDEELIETNKYMELMEKKCNISLSRAKDEVLLLRNKIDESYYEGKSRSYEISIAKIRDLTMDALYSCSPKETYIHKEHLKMTDVKN